MSLRRIQRGIEKLYRLDTAPDVRNFLIQDDAPVRLRETRRPREQLFVGGTSEDLRLGVFVDQAVLETLRRHNPSRGLDQTNLADLLLAVEAVSHFLCVIHCVRARRPVRALELELQAEIDKYLVCLLLLEAQGRRRTILGLAENLAVALQLADNLNGEEHGRYARAATFASSYAAALQQRYVRTRRLMEMLDEVRHFYRLGLDAKVNRITLLAA